MRLSALAEAFEQIAATGVRARRVEIVAALLRRASRGERPAIVYLLQAQLRPAYEGVEVGLGERLLTRALADAYGARKLRLGVGDQTILEAATVTALGGRDRKAILEHAYDVRSDLGGVIARAFSGGARALARIARGRRTRPPGARATSSLGGGDHPPPG